MSTICMKIDPDMHIGLHLVFSGKTGVTHACDTEENRQEEGGCGARASNCVLKHVVESGDVSLLSPMWCSLQRLTAPTAGALIEMVS
jgi:hypothetical protein